MTDATPTPPHDLAAEQAVLGAMLLSGAATAEAVEMLRAADFYRPAHQLVFAAAADLFQDGEAADPITVADELTKRGEIARIDGAPYLHTLIASVATAANLRSHAKIVKEKALLRSLAEAGTRIVQMSYAIDGTDAASALQRAQAELFALDSRTVGGQSVDDDAVREKQMLGALNVIEAAGSGKPSKPVVPTGHADLDALTGGGLRAGQVHTIFGTTGIGTSMLALGFARTAAIKHGLTTVIFSGQSPATETRTRILSAEARVPGHAMRSGTMTDEDWTRFARRMSETADAPLYINDDPSLSFTALRAECRRLKRNRDLRLIIIDGVNLYARPTAPESLWAAQVRLSADIKRLAAELAVAIVITVPTNRRADNRLDRRPTLPDIASSSAYAADADLIIGLHREDAYERESPRAGEADLIVLKHRHGPTATVTVAFQGHYARFVDMVPAAPMPTRLRQVDEEEN